MNQSKKEFLKREADSQLKALKTISHWRTLALALSAAGVALTYAGFAAAERILWLGITGILLITAGFIGAAVFNLGIKNGRQNVKRMIEAMEGYGK